ncbi:MAG: hypothetical protein IKA62_03995 [Clostridia bacterium]|nr:hypothetical protein [Clostridia bacterium]
MEFIKTVWCWLRVNWLDVSLIIVGASAFFTYYCEIKRKRKTAATIIINQIKEIDEAILQLQKAEALNTTVIYKSKAIMSENYWTKYRHLLIRKLSPVQISTIEVFYSQAEEIEKSRLSVCNEILATFNNKELVYQLKVAEEIINTGGFAGKKSPLYEYYKSRATYISKLPMSYLTDNLRTFRRLVDTPDGIDIYKKLKKLSYLK